MYILYFCFENTKAKFAVSAAVSEFFILYGFGDCDLVTLALGAFQNGTSSQTQDEQSTRPVIQSSGGGASNSWHLPKLSLVQLWQLTGIMFICANCFFKCILMAFSSTKFIISHFRIFSVLASCNAFGFFNYFWWEHL